LETMMMFYGMILAFVAIAAACWLLYLVWRS
jgi:hypothetical protein